MDLGEPSSYFALSAGTPVYSCDGSQIGKVHHVLGDTHEDVFDGIIIGEHVLGTDHRFADADDVEAIYDRGVVLKLDGTSCADLPKPSPNPAVMRDDPAESGSELRRQRLMRAWDRLSGNR
jgi:uncharacterized protein YrrD